MAELGAFALSLQPHEHRQPDAATVIDTPQIGSTAPATARRIRRDNRSTDPPSRRVAQRSVVVRLLARIDRKLGVLLRQADKRPGCLLTIIQAAAIAGVSPTTIRRAIHLPDGPDKLHAYDQSLGHSRASWRIDPADLDAWRKRREGRPAAISPRTIRVSAANDVQFKF